MDSAFSALGCSALPSKTRGSGRPVQGPTQALLEESLSLTCLAVGSAAGKVWLA